MSLSLRKPPPSLWLTLPALIGLGATGCADSRARPTGVEEFGPPTVTVSVTEPDRESVMPSDSTSLVVIEAIGEVRAIGYFIKVVSELDTVARARREFQETLVFVEAEFGVRIPALPTGAALEVRGVAEDAQAVRHLSEPVFVTVIECDLFPQACIVGRGVGGFRARR
jgi:hypothetical protein